VLRSLLADHAGQELKVANGRENVVEAEGKLKLAKFDAHGIEFEARLIGRGRGSLIGPEMRSPTSITASVWIPTRSSGPGSHENEKVRWPPPEIEAVFKASPNLKPRQRKYGRVSPLTS